MAGLSEQEKQQLVASIDRVPEFRGIGVGFEGRGVCIVARPSPMPPGLQTWVILSEQETASLPEATADDASSSLSSEFLNMGLSCGSAVFAGVAAAGGVGAAPLTGGASIAVTVVVWAGAVATAAQCGIATGRVINELFDPGSNERYLDSEEWYQIAGSTLDAISIAGGVAGVGQAAQAAIRLSKTSGRPLTQILKGMTRAERKRLAQDLARYSGEAPTRRAFIRLARAGKIPRLFTPQQVNQAVVNELLNSISSGLTFTGSATSGVVRQVTVHFLEDE